MSWPDEAISSLRGCWRLFLRDTGGFDDFDISVRGFWRSFAVIIAIAPFYLYAVVVHNDIQLPDQPPAEPLSMNLVAAGLVVQWFCWPLIVAIVARFGGLARNFARYVVVYNWSSIPIIVLQMVPIMLFSLGASALTLATLVYYVFFGAVLYYRWYIAQKTFETTSAVAWALVLGDLVFSIAVHLLIG